MKRIVGILFFALFTCLLNAQEVKQIEKSDDESGFKWREVYNGQNWGVQSVSGQEIIPCQFLSIYYSCGYFIVSNGKCNGLFDLKGKEIISPDRGYTGFSVYNAKDGYLVVKKDNMAGLTDLTGKEIISPDRGYTDISVYNAKDGYFVVKKDNMAGLTDLNGREIISPDHGYTDIYVYNAKDGYFEVKKDNMAGLTDLTGKEIISPDRGYTDIYVYNAKDGYFEVKKDNMAGLTDLTGKEIISPDRGYTSISMLTVKDGFLVVEKNGKGVVNTQGTEIIPPVYGFDGCEADHYYTKDGIIEVSKKSGDPDMPFIRGLFSTDGKELIPLSKGYRAIDILGGGIVQARKNYNEIVGDKFLISDLKRGISSSYDQLYFDSDLNCKIGKKGRYMCLLDKDNNELIPLSAHLVEIYRGSNPTNKEFKVKDENGNVGIVTSALNWVIPLGRKYTTLLQLGGGDKAPYYLVGIGDYRGVCDMAGRLIMDVAYDVAGVDENGLAYGVRDGSTYFAYNYVDSKGYYDKRKSEAAKSKMRQEKTMVSNNNFYIPILLNALANAAATQSYSGGSGSTGSSSSSSVATGRTPRQCGLCGGSGQMVMNDVVSFGSTDQKWCKLCQRFVSMEHRHATCISCNGKGSW